MRIVHLKIVINMVMFLSLILLYGCPSSTVTYTPPSGPGPAGPPQPAAGEIGRFDVVQGPNVTVAGRPARVNMAIHEREEVRTGPGSTATIRFNGGGMMQLDETTDPIFSLIRGASCILIQMFTGHAQLDSQGRCFEAETPESDAFVHSKVDLRVQSGRTTWTVLEGRIEVSSRQNPNVKTPVMAGQRAEVLRERVEPLRQIPPTELRELQTRFMRIQVAPAPRKTEPSAPSIHFGIGTSVPTAPPRHEPSVPTAPPRTEPSAPSSPPRIERSAPIPAPNLEPSQPPLR